MNSTKPATATLLNKIRRAARDLARDTQAGISYTAALDQLSREAGYASWRAATTAAAAPTGRSPAAEASDLPVDPELPDDFDNTRNESRSQAELDAWWMRPFAVSRQDGRLDVRCLDGGSWDRSTWWGTAEDLEQAREIARRGLERSQKMHDTVSAFILDDCALLTIDENRPGMHRPVLRVCELAQLGACSEEWRQLAADNPGQARAIIHAARARTARLPAEEDLVVVENYVRRHKVRGQDEAEPTYEQWLMLLTLLKLADAGRTECALPELRYYLSNWWDADSASTWKALQAAAHLHVPGQAPAIRTCEVRRGAQEPWQALQESDIHQDAVYDLRVTFEPDAAAWLGAPPRRRS